MLTYLPEGTQPDIDALGNGAIVNDHGHGYAIVADTRIIAGRGMQASAVIDEFAALRRLHPEGPALFHSRFATHGSVNESNNHPFPVGGDELTVLAHNGVLPAAAQPAKGDDRSDTRIAADDIFGIPPFSSFDDPKTCKLIERWLGRFNKVVILTANPRYRRNGYIFNEHKGVWNADCWYSNRDFETHAAYLSPEHAGWWGLDQGCTYCGVADAINPEHGLCLACGFCPVCGADERDCGRGCYRLLLTVPCEECSSDIRFCACPIPDGHFVT
ncbi:hypothetical protein DMH01_14595 [Amycolatopsis sp. WAC 04182]|nr:hypothetical protein BS330_28815 [Amycolatopsis keratiniphila subsp. nogabecina]RSN60533.1 hypothetical protein DMH01_14595 [Amycolatopsis sp. WAC 04182]